MSRAVADIMPEVTVPPRPNGLPMASTQSPTLALVESPQAAAGSGFGALTFNSTRSLTESRPTTCACKLVLSDNVTVICSALAITWLLVTIRPEGSMIKPEPRDATGGANPLGPPGVPFSPRKSWKNWSSGEPGAGACPWGASFGRPATPAWVVEMLTTTPSSRAARSAKTSENGVVIGGSARLGVAPIINTINNAARNAPRRPITFTRPVPSPGLRDAYRRGSNAGVP